MTIRTSSHSSDLPADNHLGITIEAMIHPAGSKNIVVRGKFRVPYDKDGIPDQATQILKHVVLVVTRSGNYQSVTPFKEVIVFDDDVKDEGDACSGFFNIQAMDHIAFNGEGDYYLLCSMGTYLSNTVCIKVS